MRIPEECGPFDLVHVATTKERLTIDTKATKDNYMKPNEMCRMRGEAAHTQAHHSRPHKFISYL